MRPMLIIHSNIKSQTVICSFGMNMTGWKTWGLRYKQTFFKFAHFIHFQNSKMKTPKSCAESAICWQSLLVYHPSFFFFFPARESQIWLALQLQLTILRGEPVRESEMMESKMGKHSFGRRSGHWNRNYGC